MKITAATTDGEILGPVESAKYALLNFVTDQMKSEYLQGERMVTLAQQVRDAEALASAQMSYRSVCQNNPERRLEVLFDLVAATDDTWSGRGNDSRRSAQDAVRAWAKVEVIHITTGH